MPATADQQPAYPPRRQGFTGGVHDPARDQDSCGIAAVARMDSEPQHEVIERAIVALERIAHRGATGADPETGDGAGILCDLPREFLAGAIGRDDLPESGRLAVAVCFLPTDSERRREIGGALEDLVTDSGHEVICWREVPTEIGEIGRTAREAAPAIRQLLIAAGPDGDDQDAFERELFMIRRRAERRFEGELYLPSFSSKTIVYKGMLTNHQLARFYPDLSDPSLLSRFAVVHSRFSTNTLPSWDLAQPLRMVSHNGEINTALGNVNWMRAREGTLASDLFGPDLRDALPLISETASDSAAFDNALELITHGGRSLSHAMMMMIPMAHEHRDDLPEELKGFYSYHTRIQEPWDGPVAMTFCDGRKLGAIVDRNGLRPGRWLTTTDGWLALGSESGIFDVEPENVARKGRFRPAGLLILDLETGYFSADGEIELEEAKRHPYADWDAQRTRHLDDVPTAEPTHFDEETLEKRQLAFGYTQEDLKILLKPMAETQQEPTGSMGNDLSLAVFSNQEPSLFSYFKQRFAQVTNPAIDSVREFSVMSLKTRLGSKGKLLSLDRDGGFQLELDQPILGDRDIDRLHGALDKDLQPATIDTTWALKEGPEGMLAALDRVRQKADEAIAEGATNIYLSDRLISPRRVPIPSLLSLGAVHQHLVSNGTRLQASLVVESGEPREIHHLACLVGFGATAINPYVMLESIEAFDDIIVDGRRLEPGEVLPRAMSGIRKGLLKVLSKMGISTIHSYRGAQIFEAIGISGEVIDEFFTGTPSPIEGIGLDEIAREAFDRHARGYPAEHGRALPEHVEEDLLPADHADLLPQGGVYRWRRDGEKHMWDPETIASLQRSVRANGNGAGAEAYEEFRRRVDEENSQQALLRGLLELAPEGEPIPVEEVEPASEIVKRFATGAMSLGALSRESHETLAIAMNRIGAHSNSGEGGEDRRRNRREPNGDLRRSRIRQVASGRFGVDVEYLSRADQIQIKVAQGAKPGEGGQLPGHKVDNYIASLRHSTPGVELISPPPHHDIYSIEDLKQLIYDLRMANPRASVSVKLAAEAGVGTVAAGVVKCGADHIVIAGHDGGTGASPQSSIQSAGVPWELGISEAQQALLDNELRSRVILQADGQMRTGRDVIVAALLGADEFGFSTAPLIATGCIMMRVCHLNTCPVGVATQDPVLRERFAGTPDQVVTYMMYVAEEVRALMAKLGARELGELIGRTELLRASIPGDNPKLARVDVAPLLAVPPVAPTEGARGFLEGVSHDEVAESFDTRVLLPAYRHARVGGEVTRVRGQKVTNTDLAVGGALSNAVVAEHGHDGLAPDSIDIRLVGSAGQSCGAWLAGGISLSIEGDVNDYAGKGLSGGVLSVRPHDAGSLEASESIIAGNVALYGATRGRAFFCGQAGERFAVRNSGASAVVEGIGEHGCEYMTGGTIVILGGTGQNFGAGMSGGVAFVHDPDGMLSARTNHELVDLDPVDLRREDEIRALIEEHVERTGSTVGRRMLDRWSEALEELVMVIPRGYKEAMAREARTTIETAA